MKKIKILQVNKLYYPYVGGIEKVVQQIAEGLNERADVKVLVCQDKGRGKKEIINNVKVYRSPSLGIWGNLPLPYRFFSDLKKLSKDRDIIHVHMPFPFADIACLLLKYKGKIIVWWHSDIVRQKKLMVLYKPIMMKFLKRVDKIIVATEGNLQNSEYLKIFKEKCIVIPFGVDRKIEQVSESYFKSLRNSFVLNTDDVCVRSNRAFRFLFVGRLVYYKGCKELLQAFSKLYGKVELDIVGTGPLESELKKQVSLLKIEHKVHFHSNVSDEQLYKYYEMCDVFVLPSVAKSEAFGLVQIEAMAFGKPVINTRLESGVPYVSIHGETGLTIEAKNVDELARAMEWMMKHTKQRELMGMRARKRMEKEYRLETMIERVFDLYHNL